MDTAAAEAVAAAAAAEAAVGDEAGMGNAAAAAAVAEAEPETAPPAPAKAGATSMMGGGVGRKGWSATEKVDARALHSVLAWGARGEMMVNTPLESMPSPKGAAAPPLSPTPQAEKEGASPAPPPLTRFREVAGEEEKAREEEEEEEEAVAPLLGWLAVGGATPR